MGGGIKHGGILGDRICDMVCCVWYGTGRRGYVNFLVFSIGVIPKSEVADRFVQVGLSPEKNEWTARLKECRDIKERVNKKDRRVVTMKQACRLSIVDVRRW